MMSDQHQKILTVSILSRGPNHVIVNKPPSVLCHHTMGSWKKKLKDGEEPEVPMLQRVRDVMDHIDNGNQLISDSCENNEKRMTKMKRRLNLVHRLDRGTSGALLFAFADNDNDEGHNIGKFDEMHELGENNYGCNGNQKGPTATLQEEMGKPTSIKTYVAIVRGDGILRGEDLKQKGWFAENRQIKDQKGRLHDATTLFHFIAGQRPDDKDEDSVIMKPRISLVLARPQNGRWHQIRRHLNGLSHHILGDGTHGCSKTNKEWKQKRNFFPAERIMLHLARLQIPPTKFTANIDCLCPIPSDMLRILQVYAPDVLREAMPVLIKEGIVTDFDKQLICDTYMIQPHFQKVDNNDENYLH